MRIIFSRKGFDSASGCCPSPILPDGRMISLPIPVTARHARPNFASLHAGGLNLGELVENLVPTRHRGQINAQTGVHLDPDLDGGLQKRPSGWRPAFGQVEAAQSHLAREGVQPGDLFLFFGWFRRVECEGGLWRYVKGAPHVHVLFGWLQIDEIWSFARQFKEACARHPWLRKHAHADIGLESNTVYVSREHLQLNGARRQLPGGGVFGKFHPDLQLTWPGESRCKWRLPEWAEPVSGKPPLTYHRRTDAWKRRDGAMELRTVGRGQEFVLDCAHYPEAVDWALALVERHQ